MYEMEPSAQLPPLFDLQLDDNADQDHVQPSTAAAPAAGPSARRALRLALGASSFALAIPFYLAGRIIHSGPVRRVSQETANLFGMAFDTVVDLALERLHENMKLQSFISMTIQQQLGQLHDDAAVFATVEVQAKRLIAAFGHDPAPLIPLVQNAADSYIRSVLSDPNLVNDLVQRVAADYLADLHAHPESIDGLVQALGNQYIHYLHTHPEIMDPFVEQVALRLMDRLRANPEELHTLTEVLGDRYISYLRANPEGVQDLLQGQSQTLAKKVVGEVRDRSENADQSLENLVRSLLGGRLGRGPSRGTA